MSESRFWKYSYSSCFTLHYFVSGKIVLACSQHPKVSADNSPPVLSLYAACNACPCNAELSGHCPSNMSTPAPSHFPFSLPRGGVSPTVQSPVSDLIHCLPWPESLLFLLFRPLQVTAACSFLLPFASMYTCVNQSQHTATQKPSMTQTCLLLWISFYFFV